MTQTLPWVNQVRALRLDPRSYHVFSEERKNLLFDRATGAIVEVPDTIFDVLRQAESGRPIESAISEHVDGFDSIGADEIVDFLEQLREHGFFRYIAVDLAEQERMLHSLWRHKPRRIQLLIAQSCNLGCRYCYAWRNGSNQKNVLMSWPVAKRAVDFLIERSGGRPHLQVTFFGGEPLLNFDILKRVVEYCESIKETVGKTFSYELITNATLLSEEVAHFLAEYKFLMMISIDGWREMHNYNRPSLRGMDEYEIILKNATYLLQLFRSRNLPEIKVRANLTQKYHDADGVRRHLHSLGFRKIGIAAIEPLSHSDPSPSAMTDQQVEDLAAFEFAADLEAIADYQKASVVHPTRVQRLRTFADPLQTVSVKGIMCGVARNTAVVDTKGNIYPCHRYEGMEKYIVGNVFTGMDYEKTMGYYRKVNGNATNRCHSCWLRDYCAGGCAWLLSSKTGVLVDPTERECNRRRKTMERSLYLRTRLREVAPQWFETSGNRTLTEFSFGVEAAGEEQGCSSGCGECGSGCSS